MMHKKLLGIDLPTDSQSDALEKILESAQKRSNFHHVYSLNPEIFTLMSENPEFKKAVQWAWMKNIDGVGVVLAARFLGIATGDRLTGVDMMDKLIKLASDQSLSIMLIGGKHKVADKLADCYEKIYPRLNIYGFQGISDISHPTKEEEKRIFSIVADRKPQIIFAAFGSPAQELWLYHHRKKLKDMVCIGVGGSFDFLSGDVSRAPMIMRRFGMEWAYRLIKQPWRWRRQLRILKFLFLVLQQKRGRGMQ